MQETIEYNPEELIDKHKYTDAREAEIETAELFFELIHKAASDSRINEYELGVYTYLLAKGASSASVEDLVERFYLREEVENTPVTADWQRQGMTGVKSTLRRLVDISCKRLAALGYVGGGEASGWWAK